MITDVTVIMVLKLLLETKQKMHYSSVQVQGNGIYKTNDTVKSVSVPKELETKILPND